MYLINFFKSSTRYRYYEPFRILKIHLSIGKALLHIGTIRNHEMSQKRKRTFPQKTNNEGSESTAEF